MAKRFHPATKAKPGNEKALTHGAHSERKLAPIRERHEAELREEFPKMDRRVRAILANRLAKIELADDYLTKNGVVKNDEGDVYAVAVAQEKWARRAEDILRAAGVEKEQSSPVEVAMAIAALSRGD